MRLDTLASKMDIPDEMVDVRVIKKILRATATNLIPKVSIEEQVSVVLLFRNQLSLFLYGHNRAEGFHSDQW